MMTSRRSIIIFWTLLLVSALVLAGSAFRQLGLEQDRILRAGITALEDQSRLVTENIDRTMDAIQTNLTRSLLNIHAKDLPAPILGERLLAWEASFKKKKLRKNRLNPKSSQSFTGLATGLNSINS